jgi:hypothetical protein
MVTGITIAETAICVCWTVEARAKPRTGPKILVHTWGARIHALRRHRTVEISRRLPVRIPAMTGMVQPTNGQAYLAIPNRY